MNPIFLTFCKSRSDYRNNIARVLYNYSMERIKKKKKREKSDSADSSLITSDTNKSIESKMHGVENSFSVKLRWTFVYYFTDRFRLTLNYHMLDHKRMSAAPRNNRVTPTRSYFSFDLWKWFVDKCAWINIIFVCFSFLFK